MNRDPLLWNKILGAVLGALLIGTLSAFVADLLYGQKHGEAEEVFLSLVSVEPSSAEPNSAEASSSDTSAATLEPEVPLAERLAQADVAHGKNISRKCVACHTFTPDGANRIGPNLWAVAGRKVAAVSGFQYSKAMKSFGGTWADERLEAFLKRPKEAVAGTKMNFVGIKKAQDRADIIAWLQTLR